MKTNIEKIGGEWKVTFTHGSQTFTLDYAGTKKECEWYKARLDECFNRAFQDVVSNTKNNFKNKTMDSTEKRRSGRTTRLADQYIQQLFDTGKVKVIDHSNHAEGSRFLIDVICRRLNNEHKRTKYNVDLINLIIKLSHNVEYCPNCKTKNYHYYPETNSWCCACC